MGGGEPIDLCMPKSISPAKAAMRAARVVFAAANLFVLADAASAASSAPPPGAASCSGCHATDAKTETSVPRIAGSNPADIVAAMAAFRAGQKPATVMDRIAKGFTDDEVRAIADWLGEQK
jgi:cytochrome subunit of sulfide dehydrogenase